MKMFEDLTQEEVNEMKTLLRQCGAKERAVALEAQEAFAAELSTPLRQGVTVGNILDGIFARTTFDPNARVEYPIDLFRPDNDSEFTAYTIPNQGSIPQRHVEGDYVTVPTFDIGSSIDFLIRYASEARFDVVGRALEVMQHGFVKKMNDDGWHTLLAAGVDRNILTSDANAVAGEFTKRLISLMKLVVRRNAGGNSNSLNRGRLTHVYLSPEAIEDMRNWDLSQIDDITRREIYTAGDETFNRVYGVTLVALDELGENQEYQDYYTNTLGASLAASDVEVLVGLDLSSNDSFVMPVREEIQVFAADDLHRQRRMGFYGWGALGFAVMDNRRIILGSL